MHNLKRFLVFILVGLVLALCGCEFRIDWDDSYLSQSEDSSKASVESGDNVFGTLDNDSGLLKVHFIDVGQGDSTFIELPDGKCMLIDAGERDYAGRVISLIDCLGYKKIDYLVATHPHSDHIGGMQRVVESFEIGDVFMPDAVTDTSSFINFLESLDARKLSVTVAKAGKRIFAEGALAADFIAPVMIVEDLNNCSAIVKLTYGEKTFLFMGDAEVMEEETLLPNLKCDVLKVGHHGSRTSSGNSFLSKCKPSVAVISCGADNEYGHPHREALDRLDKNGVSKIYRTDISGTIKASTDGKQLELNEGEAIDGYRWVLNIGNKKLHTINCDSAVEMKEINRAYSIRSLDELTKLGYSLCGTCKPKE